MSTKKKSPISLVWESILPLALAVVEKIHPRNLANISDDMVLKLLKAWDTANGQHGYKPHYFCVAYLAHLWRTLHDLEHRVQRQAQPIGELSPLITYGYFTIEGFISSLICSENFTRAHRAMLVTRHLHWLCKRINTARAKLGLLVNP